MTTSVSQSGRNLIVEGVVTNRSDADACFEGTSQEPLGVDIVRVRDGAQITKSQVVEALIDGKIVAHDLHDASRRQVATVPAAGQLKFTTVRILSPQDEFVTVEAGTTNYVGTLVDHDRVIVRPGAFFVNCSSSRQDGSLSGPMAYVSATLGYPFVIDLP